MATLITKKEFKKHIEELEKVLAGIPDGRYVCPACHMIKQVPKKPSFHDLDCWCDYESQDIEP